MKWISLVCVLCLLQLANAACECGNGQQSFVPSYTIFHPPHAIIDPPGTFNNNTIGPSSFGSTCVEQRSLYNCTNITLFDCSASNNSYYGWDGDHSERAYSIIIIFGSNVQSVNILMTFLISTSSDISAPTSLQYTPLNQDGNIISTGQSNDPPIILSEGTYQHNVIISPGVMFYGVTITMTPNATFPWVAVNRIVLCPATEDQSSSSSTVSMLTPLMSPSSSSMLTAATDASTVPSSDNDDDLVSVAVISGAVVGISLLALVIINITLVMIMISCSRRGKKSMRAYNIDNKVSHVPNPQRHTHNTSGQSHDHTGSDTLAKVYPTSRLETVNALCIPTKVKSLDSLLQQHDTSRTGVIGCDVIITPNPSYAVGPNSLETGKECEHQYDYVQTDDGLVQHDKVVESTTSGVYDEVTDPAGNVNNDPNSSYSLAQDDQNVNIDPNPSYSLARDDQDVNNDPNPSYSIAQDDQDVNIDPNPSYSLAWDDQDVNIDPNPSYSLAQDDQDVNIDPNPSYSLVQDDQNVRLEDNPSYGKLKVANNL